MTTITVTTVSPVRGNYSILRARVTTQSAFITVHFFIFRFEKPKNRIYIYIFNVFVVIVILNAERTRINKCIHTTAKTKNTIVSCRSPTRSIDIFKFPPTILSRCTRVLFPAVRSRFNYHLVEYNSYTIVFVCFFFVPVTLLRLIGRNRAVRLLYVRSSVAWPNDFQRIYAI